MRELGTSKALEVQKQTEHWFQSALGRRLIANQRPVIESLINRMFGFHQVEIGVSHRIPVGNPSNLGHKFSVVPEWEEQLPENTVIASSDELPLDHDIADLVILHHTLDCSNDPHQTIRECSRVLKSSGHLLVVGFNPVSTWGIRRVFSRKRGAPWNNRFISGSRIEDWLTLLDFKVSDIHYHFYQLPLQSSKFTGHFSWLDSFLNAKVPLGAYYTILAQKQVGSRIRVEPKWKKKAKVVGLPLANRVRSDKHSS